MFYANTKRFAYVPAVFMLRRLWLPAGIAVGIGLNIHSLGLASYYKRWLGHI